MKAHIIRVSFRALCLALSLFTQWWPSKYRQDTATKRSWVSVLTTCGEHKEKSNVDCQIGKSIQCLRASLIRSCPEATSFQVRDKTLMCETTRTSPRNTKSQRTLCTWNVSREETQMSPRKYGEIISQNSNVGRHPGFLHVCFIWERYRGGQERWMQERGRQGCTGPHGQALTEQSCWITIRSNVFPLSSW